MLSDSYVLYMVAVCVHGLMTKPFLAARPARVAPCLFYRGVRKVFAEQAAELLRPHQRHSLHARWAARSHRHRRPPLPGLAVRSLNGAR